MAQDKPKPTFLLLLAAVATVLLALIIAPFAGAFFAAAVFAGVLYPAQEGLARRLGDRPRLAATLLTVGVTALAVAPIAGLTVYVTQQLTVLYRRGEEFLEREGFDGVIEHIPEPLRGLAQRLVDLAAPSDPLPDAGSAVPEPAATGDVQLTGSQIETAAGLATEMFGAVTGLLIDLGVLIIALFFLLSQGTRLVDWIIEVLPLPEKHGTKLVEEFRDVTRAVFAATIATASLQTLIATIAYLIAGVPYLPAVILLTFIASLIPVFGAAAVVVIVGGIFLLYGQIGLGVFLIVWGAVPVGLSDNLVKPWLTQGSMRLPGAVVLFAMMGGVAVFGPMGIVAGPLIAAFFFAAVRLLREEGVLGESS